MKKVIRIMNFLQGKLKSQISKTNLIWIFPLLIKPQYYNVITNNKDRLTLLIISKAISHLLCVIKEYTTHNNKMYVTRIWSICTKMLNHRKYYLKKKVKYKNQQTLYKSIIFIKILNICLIIKNI